MPEQTVVVGAILSADRDGCINGYRFGARDLICFPAGAELDYLLPAQTRWAALQLPRSMLAHPGLSPAPFRQPRVFPASLPGCAAVVRRLARLTEAGADGAVGDIDGEVRALAADLTRVADLCSGPAGRPAYAERMRQLRCFEQLVRERIGEQLRIPELCAAIGVAQRTLEQSFREHVGVSPKRYLTILRLHVAREALLRGTDTEIGTLAADCGLPHPGRFATEYRRLFGESPSATARA
jgi:AraC family ethanolamine operon transcriptional activator